MRRFLIFTAVLVCGLIFCKGPMESGECSPIADADKSTELVAPVSGSFKTGDHVEVAWKVNPQDIDQVVVQISTTGISGPWDNVFKDGIAVPREGSLVCMDTTWVVGQEYDDVDYSSSTSVLIRVAWYNHEGDDWARDVSSTITVSP